MEPSTYPLVQTGTVPKGTEAFEVLRRKLLHEFESKVPKEYYLPQELVKNPPLDVRDVPRTCGILTARELEITENYDAYALAGAIATRKYTAVETATAFLKRAIIADQLTRCLTQWLPDEALAQAKTLDEHLARTGKTVGPLHGVPVSIKQHMPIAGTVSDVGFVSTQVKDDKDSQMVAILRELGAVFYVKTMQPQAIMHLETDCHLGRTLNPYNINLSSGGSSGGEGALVALRGSVLGVGTDIGGSIRGPAGMCGIYGFKPTSYTLPMRDFLRGGFPAELNILCSTGPMTNSLRDVDWFMHLILSKQPHLTDPRLVPIPWTGRSIAPRNKTLKVGIMLDDGVIQPQPPVGRALEWARQKLAGVSGVEVKPFKPYQTAEAMRQIRLAYWPEGGEVDYAAAEQTGEPLHPLTVFAMRDARGPAKTGVEISKMRGARDEFRMGFAEHWNEQDVDVVLCPMHVGPAPVHDTAVHWNYTAVWNYVDYPGIVFPTPVRTKSKGEEKYANTEVWGEHDAHVRELWETNDYVGAPINLQLLARKYHDNALFEALSVMSEALELK